MKDVAKNSGEQKWPAWKKVAIFVQLGVAVIGTWALPMSFLEWAEVSRAGGDRAWADRWEELSYGVVALGPTLFVTSFLAMASQFLRFDRWVVRVGAVLLAAFILVLLLPVGPKIHISLALSLVGVLYSVAADAFTPDSSYKTTSDDDVGDVDGSQEAVAKPEAADASVIAAQ